MDPQDIRDRLRFDIDRLRDAAWRLERIDAALSELRTHLEARARKLSQDATHSDQPEIGGAHAGVHVRYAQAFAVAALAKKAALREVVSVESFALVASMAVTRWLLALRGIGRRPHGERMIHAEVEAGRVAYRLLVLLRRKRGLIFGLGQLVAAVVVAEFAHPADAAFVSAELKEGLLRAHRGGADAERALAGSSAALREAAHLLEVMAERAEPIIERLLLEADAIEAKVELDLLRRGS
ncbi:MAG: hypothetical protein U1E65_14095 [Myxococcota bacterium]